MRAFFGRGFKRRRRPGLAVARLLVVVLALRGGASPGSAAADDEAGMATATIRIHSARPQLMAANLGDAYRGRRLEADRDAFEAAFGSLAERHDFSFRDTPLRDAVAGIAEKTGVRIGFDREALDAAGVDPATPVTGSFADCSAESALRELLADVDLAAVFRNERLVVTTVDAARGRLVRWFYPLPAGVDVDAVIDLVTRTVTPAEWDSVGGQAAIVPLPERMGAGVVVHHDDEAQRQVLALLAGLDAAAWQADDVDEGVEPRHLRIHPLPDPLVRDTVVEHLVDLCNESLAHGADPDAAVSVLGEAVAVRSTSRPFHVLAAQVIAALGGLEAFVIDEEIEEDAGAKPGAEAGTTAFRRGGRTR
jgi:hypothetical protein